MALLWLLQANKKSADTIKDDITIIFFQPYLFFSISYKIQRQRRQQDPPLLLLLTIFSSTCWATVALFYYFRHVSYVHHT